MNRTFLVAVMVLPEIGNRLDVPHIFSFSFCEFLQIRKCARETISQEFVTWAVTFLGIVSQAVEITQVYKTKLQPVS